MPSLRIGIIRGKLIADEIAILMRIGVDDAPDRPMLGGDFRFDAAPRSAIPRDDDRAFHADAEAIEFLVILRHAMVHVDQRRGDIAVD